MKPSSYIETSIVSYLVARPSFDLLVAAHQQVTLEWWTKIQPKINGFISPFVIEEISKGDPEAAKKRLEAISQLSILQNNKEIEELAKIYFDTLNLPKRAKLDAFHLMNNKIYQHLLFVRQKN